MITPSHPTHGPALQKIRDGETVTVYALGNFATPRHVDFVCRSGLFDVIWFDLEQFDLPMRDLAVMNMVTRATSVSTIARIKAADYQVVMRTLETGVDGLMCAMVEDAAEARQIVEWAKFNNPSPSPGEAIGNRGWNGGNVDAGYGAVPALDYIREQNTQTFILCQIEHARAVANAAEIAAVPGVDGLFFGPGDYSAGLGLPGQVGHPKVVEAMAAVAEAAKANGKWWGTVAPGHENFARARKMGGQFLSPGGDVKVMTLGIKELWKVMQEDAPAPAPAKGSSSTY